ncbi:MAG: lactate utilization protein [bacterium]|nr:lactate utilization protein [bacterium]
MNPKEQSYKNLSETLIKKLALRNMEGYYCNTKEEAKDLALSLMEKGSSVTWGGSMTISEIGLLDALSEDDYTILDRSIAKTPEEQREFYGRAVMADYFLMSSNAITLDGQLVNIDGNGNRVACLITGPRNVIVIAGINKLVPDVKSGIERVHNFAAPPNGVRLNTGTPCSTTGVCANCLADGCMCCQEVVTRKSRVKGRIKVIIVGESLGY